MKLRKLAAPVLSLSLLMPAMAHAATPTTTKMEMEKPSVNTPAVELRAGLDQLLSEHFVLAVKAMTTAYDGSEEEAKAALDALDQNAVDMGPAIASIYGEAGATQFENIFRPHNMYTDEEVKAMKKHDIRAVVEARAKVDQFVIDFGNFLGTATERILPAETAIEVVRLHEKQVQEVFDAYVAGDYTEQYAHFREGYQEMFTISKALSTAIVTQFPEKFDNTKADTKAADLRSTLNSLAAEHFAIATIDMQKEYDGASDMDAAAWAQDEHTADFTAAIESIYGAEGAAAFEKLWTTDHIIAQSDMVRATKDNDAAARAAVIERINGFAKEFGEFLGTATGGSLPTADAQEALMEHESQVQKTFDEYVAADYKASYDTFREGFGYMFGVGQALGNAIVTQFPKNFQQDMTTVWMKINSNQLIVNDKITMMDTVPMMSGDFTFIPLRFLSEGIGAEVKWDPETQTVWVMAGEDTLTFWIGKDYMDVNGTMTAVGTKVFINEDGRTQAPLRFIAELLGWDVAWGDDDQSITLTKSM